MMICFIYEFYISVIIYRVFKKKTKKSSKTHMALQDSTIGGKYIIGPKIGSGSFGEVYVASELETHEIYALKKV